MEPVEARQLLESSAEGFEATMSQKEIDGAVFMISGYRLVNTKFGERRVATIRLNGRDESADCWLGGAVVDRQLKRMADESAFPMLVKLGHNEAIEGNPYVLLWPSDEEKKGWEEGGDGVAAAPGPTPKPGTFSGRSAQDDLVQFCRENGLATMAGQVDTANIMEVLGNPVAEGESAPDAFKDYCKALWQEFRCTEDETYRHVLDNLVIAIGLPAAKPGGDVVEPSPFG